MAVGDKVTLNFTMMKSTYFRVIYAEGVWGGVSPHGKINMVFYNERQALPKATSFDAVEGENGTLVNDGNEVIADSVGGIVREMEASVMMDIEQAIIFHRWLGEKIAEGSARITP